GRAGGVHTIGAAQEEQDPRAQAQRPRQEGGGRVVQPRPALSALFLGLAVCTGAAAHAGGKLTGTVRIERAPAKAAALAVVKDGSVCGKDVPDEAIIVGAERGLANV